MKKLLFCLLILSGVISKAQVYNNEWIDYSKTYYKFKLNKTGLYRIPQSVIANAGLGSTPAEYFQLWRNGVQVPIYTTIASGPLSSSDYIEFWGEMNDGKPDKELYRDPKSQLNDKWSLQSDSAAYFLTVDPVILNNLRLRDVVNNVAGNILPAEPYFMHTEGKYFKTRINSGYAVNVGQTLYSSSYDIGEGWTSGEITRTTSNSNNVFSFPNLNIYSAGPPAKFRIALSGNRSNPRSYRVRINGDSVLGKQMDYYNGSNDSVLIPATLLASNKADVVVSNLSSVSSDAMVIHQCELTYPRQFNFNAQQNFEFTLPANAAGNYLEIKNFNFGSIAPVLYDLTNGKRYIGNIATPTIVKVVLEPSLTDRRLVLVSQVDANATSITALETRNFVDYTSLSNQGNYIIITNPLLIPSSGANPIEDYKQYRSSVEGGSHTVVVSLIDELVDQFAYGIRKHPMSIRNFLLYARHNFTLKPKNVLLIGKGMIYIEQRLNEGNLNTNKLNLVPTFGWPASDMLFTANKGNSEPKLAIGRLSVVNSAEISVYLNKLKEYEAVQRVSSPLSKDKAWMKNIVHAVGSSEPSLQRILDYYMTGFKNIASDSLFAGKVYTLTKTSPEAVQLMSNNALDKLFADGISLITYFGHSSTTTLEFNLNNPDGYNNKGKYPLFITLGCVAGDFYNWSTARFLSTTTLSEKFVLAPERGAIGFIASTNFGIPHYLDIWNSRFYKSFVNTGYGKSIGENMVSAIEQTFVYTTQEDFYARTQCEATTLHGDPAVILNSHLKPDYVIEDESVKVSSGFVSVADPSFGVSAKLFNIGRGVKKELVVEVKREYPDHTTKVIHRDTLMANLFENEFSIDIPVDPLLDKGNNKIIITLDPDNIIDELYESNNSVVKEVFIYDEELRPVSPTNFSIVNKQNINFIASTANPFTQSKTYRFEIDTISNFDSPGLIRTEQSSKGGVIEFNPQITLKENTVYYWRTAPVPESGTFNWKTSSFIYLPNHESGFNQSDSGQHLASTTKQMTLNTANRLWQYDSISHTLLVRNAMIGFASKEEGDITVAVDGDPYLRNSCQTASIVFNVFDPKSFKPTPNPNGAYGSIPNSGCISFRPGVLWNYEFNLQAATARKRAMDFMDLIPSGSFVVVRSMLWNKPAGVYVDSWKSDESLYGTGNTLYHKLKNAGFSDVDSFNRPRVFAFIYQKNNNGFTPVSALSANEYDILTLSKTFKTPDTLGNVTSPVFGPAKSWKQLFWDGNSIESPNTDQVEAEVIGVSKDGTSIPLLAGIVPGQQSVDVSKIDANEYPYLQLRLQSKDVVNATPFQLKYWRLTYTPFPEGAVAPNVFFQMKDTVDVGEPIDLRLAFKNVSDVSFSDSIKAKIVITDNNNVKHIIPVQKQKPLSGNDTLTLSGIIPTKQFSGSNTLYVELNPDKDQLEQYWFNNFIFYNFYVRKDTLNPVLDVTFDNTHILNGDIVASKPSILIKLKDEARWMLLNDTALVKIQVRMPNGEVKDYNYTSDTLRFNPAQKTSNQDNTASVDFKPYFSHDGDYELIITGRDESGNSSGDLEYRVGFKVINKPMISNMLNYPNPFTTSTAFVFTITGSEVPQNLRIQILTVTGKVVREITKEELGPLRVGRNITEYKWDGTDQYGQKLGNGVYLYRVVTNLNGKSLEKYKAENDNTDKYFNNGYGKMYLMR